MSHSLRLGMTEQLAVNMSFWISYSTNYNNIFILDDIYGYVIWQHYYRGAMHRSLVMRFIEFYW